MEWHIIKLQETRSTNTYLDSIDTECPQQEGCVVTTHTQSAGRGQRGNSWEAEPGKNLTFSYLLRPEGVAPQEQFILSQAVSLAVVDVLSRYAQGFSVKWPNDIYYHDSKIAGILIEHNLSGMSISRTIVGIGLNINQQQFISDAPNPISLQQITGREYDLDAMLAEVLEATTIRYAQCVGDRKQLQLDYAAALYRKDGFYPYRDAQGEFMATIREVQPDGYLVLCDTEGRVRQYAFKEVAFII
ncbi:MAG: biotin--[acetyl-CoA-carboxylase] ligase [Bacteroidaceae bacterium]|nr:biotin--[acetyl-CoA-carboxylase] ligase [Bacteroidaceae bacterium]